MLSAACKSLEAASTAAASLRDEEIDDEVERQLAVGLAEVLQANAAAAAGAHSEFSSAGTPGQWSWQASGHPWFARLCRTTPA
jgi:hypothetical protein